MERDDKSKSLDELLQEEKAQSKHYSSRGMDRGRADRDNRRYHRERSYSREGHRGKCSLDLILLNKYIIIIFFPFDQKYSRRLN